MKTRPQRLQAGDTVGLVTLSSALKMEQLQVKIDFVESLGLNYKLGKTIGVPEGMLSGTDEERVQDLHDFIADPNIKAVFCVRGGYGIGRLMDKIDYPLLELNPKIIVGFSDVTVLHIVANEYSNLVTFHGPMLSDKETPLDELSARMYQQLFQPIEVQYSERIAPLTTLSEGFVRGELTGGNLNRLVGTLGTTFEIDVTGKIVLLEDIGESIERIDHMMNQLRLSKKLERAVGFAIGSFTNLGENETYEDVLDVMRHYLCPYNKPVLAGFQIGHCVPNIMVPIGVDALLDANEKTLTILPGVK
ncbi:MAG: LD-carboxypeptidase [Lysinibacillus sp.]